jgi:hypothetical protein
MRWLCLVPTNGIWKIQRPTAAGAHATIRFILFGQECIKLAIAAGWLERLVAKIKVPFRGKTVFGVLHGQIGQGAALPNLPFEELHAFARGADLPTCPRRAILERLHVHTEAFVPLSPVVERLIDLHNDSQFRLPTRDQVEGRLQPLPILGRVVVDGQADDRPSVGRKNFRQIGMPVQKKAVGADAYERLRPVPPHDRDKTCQFRMNRRLTTEKVKFIHGHARTPSIHPTIGVR